MYTLKVFVKPYEAVEDSDKSNKDMNADLVYRGFPITMVSLGYNPAPKKNAEPVAVQHVVVFDMLGKEPDAAQKAVLEHLHREGIVISYAWYDDDRLLGQFPY